MRAGPRPALEPQRIVLTGFMGAGKSTVGRILAARLGWRFFDIDSVIVSEQHQSVADIFAAKGEPHFRELEARAIRATLEQNQTVIALGGGAVETAEVRAMLFAEDSSTMTIYLDAPLADLLTRCTAHTTSAVRPLLAGAEPAEIRLERRLPYYRRAHLTVETSGKTPVAVVEQILTRLPEGLHPSSSTEPQRD